MRIQHNIPAMNAYRNYNANTKALQGNLQKLSSGYKINKAGDDAAGLAISEKMRAQITGLEVAQKNAKDGISLVQTAEGAMTEIHTMLNRMFSLAEQSANGTYDDDVDRQQLQNEFGKLTEEIDRIAQATNFNGKKLLDGTLAGKGSSSSSGSAGAIASSLDTTAVKATKASYETAAFTANTALDATNPYKVTFSFSDSDGNDKIVELNLYKDSDTSVKDVYVDVNGKKEKAGAVAGTAGTIAATDWKNILEGALDKVAPELKDTFTISVDGTSSKATFTAKEAGSGQMELKAVQTATAAASPTLAGIAVTKTGGDDAFDAINLSDTITNNTWDGKAETLNDAIFEVGGKKFVIYDDALTLGDAENALLADAGVGTNAIQADATNNYDTVKAAVAKINTATGLAVKQGNINANGKWTDGAAAATDTYIALKSNDAADTAQTPSTGNKAGSGLRLRVGDSTNTYDDITVSIKSLRSADLTGTIAKGSKGEGKTFTLDKLSVAKDSDADLAMGALKDMINYVSTERGNLGATQNRLDHTINNLSTMQENIQDAEATIRDVDVAEEMMKYTKNNILVQSAQAMLAQANQLPQGVLQLLG